MSDETDSEPVHSEDCDCHDCWQLDLHHEFLNDAVGRHPFND